MICCILTLQLTIGTFTSITLNKAGNHYEWILVPGTTTGSAVVVSADKDIMIAQFASSRTNSQEHADPAMMIAQPKARVSDALLISLYCRVSL